MPAAVAWWGDSLSVRGSLASGGRSFGRLRLIGVGVLIALVSLVAVRKLDPFFFRLKVRTVEAAFGVEETRLQVDGLIVRNEQIVRAPAPGRVTLLVGEGRRVRRGDVVVEVTPAADGDSPSERQADVDRRLNRARAAFAQMSASERENPAFGYTERQLYFYQGDVLVRLGQTVEAEVILEQALHKYQKEDLLDQTLIRFDKALCRLLEGDVEGALDLGIDAIEQIEKEFRTELLLRPAYDLIKKIQTKYGELPKLPSFRELLAERALDTTETGLAVRPT